MLKWYYKENYVRMNKSHRSLAPLRFMSQTHTQTRVHSIWLGCCSRSLMLSLARSIRAVPLHLSFTLAACNLICTHFRKRDGFLSFSFAGFLSVGCLWFQGHTSCCIHTHTIWNNSEQSNDIFIFTSFYFACFILNSITRAKHQNAFCFRNNNIDKRNGSDDILCSKVFELLRITA